MLVTSDDELAERLGLLRSHGMTTLTWQRHRGHASSYDVVEPGFNYRIDELRAALASLQLARLASRNAARLRHVRRYRELLDGVGGVTIPFELGSSPDSSAHHLFVVALSPDIRDAVRAHLQEERIQTSMHYPPIHRFTAYSELGGRRPLPRTDEVAARLVTLPLYPHMSEDDVALVCEALTRAVAAGGDAVG